MAEINNLAQEQIDKIRQACERINPIVVIQCTAYNHERYIKDALEGFVMQETDFPFVTVVHDDVSTDNTVEIIKEYAEKYPNIILPIFEKENQYSKGTLGKVMNEACKVTGAKYIAMCEGDDYWTDPLKIQKQVCFLDSHPDYSMCFHSANLKFEDGIRIDRELEHNYYSLRQREYSIDEIHKAFIVPTCSVLLRIEVYNNYRNDSNYFVGDNVLWTACASYGRIFCLAEKMSTYRVNNNGWIKRHDKSLEIRVLSTKKWYLHYKALRKNYPDVNSKQIYKNEIMFAARITYTDLQPLTNIFQNFYRFLKEYKVDYLKSLGFNISRTLCNQTKRLFGFSK